MQDKVIKLSWEVEGLCRDLEEATRKLNVLQEQSEQQQHELKIQWESKQQVLYCFLSSHKYCNCLFVPPERSSNS